MEELTYIGRICARPAVAGEFFYRFQLLAFIFRAFHVLSDIS